MKIHIYIYPITSKFYLYNCLAVSAALQAIAEIASTVDQVLSMSICLYPSADLALIQSTPSKSQPRS